MKKFDIKLEGSPADQLRSIELLLFGCMSSLDNLVGKGQDFQIIYVLGGLDVDIQILMRRLSGKERK